MSHARERDSHSSSGDEDDSDYNDDGFEGLGIVRANKQPSGLWEALTQETLGELKAHGNETAKQILKKEVLSASDESLIGSAVNQVMRGGTMTMDGRGLARFIKSYNEDQNDPSHSHISLDDVYVWYMHGDCVRPSFGYFCDFLRSRGYRII